MGVSDKKSRRFWVFRQNEERFRERFDNTCGRDFTLSPFFRSLGMIVYISGVHSGPSPAPGIGVARCLRRAFPQARLVAVDYSSMSSGLNWPEFDGFRLFPEWPQLDLQEHVKVLRDLVDRGALWLSVGDREVSWIAMALPGIARRRGSEQVVEKRQARRIAMSVQVSEALSGLPLAI